MHSEYKINIRYYEYIEFKHSLKEYPKRLKYSSE